MTLIMIVVTLLSLIIGYWYVTYKYYSRHLKRYSGPTPLPILGNALCFRNLDEILPNCIKLHKLHGKNCKFTIAFGCFMISVTDTKMLEFVLSSTKLIDKSTDYKYLNRWLGNGLLTGTGPRWKKHRKILTPAFHFQILDQFIDIFHNYSDILIDQLKKEVNNKSTNIYTYVTLCALDLICATSMGTTVDAQKNSESKYVRSVKEMCRIVMDRSIHVIKRNDTLYKLTPDYYKEQKLVKILHDYTYSVIKSRTKELDKQKNDDQVFDGDIVKSKKTLLDTLIEYKKEHQTMTDEQIREEVDTFTFAGHDTTTSAISFTLYCLAQHPEIQKQVVEELKEIFEDDFHRPSTYKDLQSMKYLEKVIKESIRLYPPVPVYGRNLAENVEYDGGILPKDLTVLINAFTLHRDPDVFPNPDHFDPERFSLENQLNRSPYAYIPFSAGSRNCIGQKFAMLEVKEVVSKVLRNYELKSCPEHKITLIAEVVLKSKTGIHVGLQKRKI